jgi:hypothetical protein
MKDKSSNTEESETKAIFSKIPLEKLSGTDENLWLEFMAAEKSQSEKKQTQKRQENG